MTFTDLPPCGVDFTNILRAPSSLTVFSAVFLELQFCFVVFDARILAQMLMKLTTVVGFTKFLAKIICVKRPKAPKNTHKSTVLFVVLGSGKGKAARKMLMKSTRG